MPKVDECVSTRMNLKAAAARFGRSTATVRDWVDKGLLTAYQPGGRKGSLEFEQADVEALMRRQARPRR